MRRKRDENEEALIEERARKKMLQFVEARQFFDFKFTVQGAPFYKEQVLEDLPSAVEELDCPVIFYDLVNDYYVSDSELGKAFVAAVADNVHNMEAFNELDRMKEFLVKTPIFAADLISELIERRIRLCQCGN
ncbi:uncharacterized protein CDV56_101461 [Aspergillus thermomutatus]|uniref:Uncharacterized protein n=1 Tax=Aspergillus thermomutatus TaxID=41047 RepID=A0A397GJI4_ASPTH|nr:uncharacterized protein CDV56_101461 [Aspergillus thermomutatus]RHZ49213.1 hypothetical protein CDV56_101461 [Aspergillus thermomutatus]